MPARDYLWPAQDHPPDLAWDEVHVWAWDLDRPTVAAEWDMLGAEEMERARRFAYPQDRDRFVRAHAGMRQLLGSYTQTPPAQIVYTNNAYGKPRIGDPAASPPLQTVQFSLSHSADVAVLAVGCQRELGIDIEVLRSIDSRVAEKYFSSQEQHALKMLPPESWLAGFYRCWTSKEALVKGEGLGLRLPLHSFDVEADPRRPAALLAVRPEARIDGGWQLVELRPASGTIGALAMQAGGASAVRSFTFGG
jgi:4'-phosphopantetheinyl transferase